MQTPDGMGADRYNERQNMKAARQRTRTPPFELAAVDSDGNELYRTEPAWTEEAARSELEACESLLESGNGSIPDEVAGFEIRRR